MTSPEHDPARFEGQGEVLDHVFRRLVLVGVVLLALAVAVIVVAWLVTHH